MMFLLKIMKLIDTMQMYRIHILHSLNDCAALFLTSFGSHSVKYSSFSLARSFSFSPSRLLIKLINEERKSKWKVIRIVWHMSRAFEMRLQSPLNVCSLIFFSLEKFVACNLYVVCLTSIHVHVHIFIITTQKKKTYKFRFIFEQFFFSSRHI